MTAPAQLPSVVHLLQSGAWGGMEKSAHLLVRTQLERNPERRVAVMFAEARGPNVEKFEATGATILEAGFRSGRALWSAPRLARMIDGWDVAHHYCEFPPYLASMSFARHARHLYTLRGGLVGHQDRLTRRLREWMNNGLVRRAAGVGANSEFGCAVLARRLGVARDRVAFLPNGFDPPEIDLRGAPIRLRKAFDLEPERRAIVSSGRLSPQKRPYLALKAARLAAEQAPEIPMALLLLGDGGERAALERLAARSNPENLRIVFAGWRADALDLVAGSDAFLFTGLMDCFANTVAEAIAVGCPIVAWRDSGGALEHLRHARPGMAFSAASAEEAARCVAHLLRKPPEGLRQPPQAWPYGRFDMADRYEAVYARMTRQDAPSPSAERSGERLPAASPPPPMRRREA